MELEVADEILDLCACGCPSDTREFVREALQIIADQRKGPHYTRDAGRFDPEFVAWSNAHHARELAHFGSRGAMYFFYYWADSKGLTEHGGSVPGWLTDEGMKLLAALSITDSASVTHDP